MAFDGTEGAPIQLEQAASWTANYRYENPDKVKAHFFGKDILQEILSQEGCMGIRIFNAIDGEGVNKLILVGADSGEDDQLEGTLADFGTPCPAMCGKSNQLNSDLGN